jgi:hypothetical protein
VRLNNPAARFDQLLTKGALIRGNTPAIKAWGTLLEMEVEPAAPLIQRIGYALALPNSIEQSILSLHGVSHGLLLKWLPRALASFQNFNLQGEWQGFFGHYVPEVRYGIEMCADVLARELPEKELNEQLLKDIADDVDALLIEVASSGLTPDMRGFLLKHLGVIKRAVAEYWLRGSEPLQTEVYALIGETNVKPERYSEGRKEKTGAKFWDIAGRIALVLEVLNGANQISQALKGVLPAPPESATHAAAHSTAPVLPDSGTA